MRNVNCISSIYYIWQAFTFFIMISHRRMSIIIIIIINNNVLSYINQRDLQSDVNNKFTFINCGITGKW